MVSWFIRNESERVGPLRNEDTLEILYQTTLRTLSFLGADLGQWVFHRARMDRTPAMSNVILPAQGLPQEGELGRRAEPE